MIYNQKGEMFFYEDKMFIVGEEVFASESDYAGLLGRITEIRTGGDRDTENEGPDIYCSFRPPLLKQDAELVSKMRFDNEELSLDLVIMAPEMLMPTRYIGGGLPTVKVYAVVEDCMIDGEDHGETRLFSDKKHAEIMMRQSIEKERENGCIAGWQSSPLLVEEQYNDLYFTVYFKNEYCFNHYTVYLQEMELSLSMPFVKEMKPICLAMKYREDIAEQIEPWDIPETVRRTAINDPSLYIRVQSALSGKELYKEEYSEAISEVAHSLTKEHAKLESILDKARKDGKL